MVQNPPDWSFWNICVVGKPVRRHRLSRPAAEAPRLPWVLEDWVSLHTAGPTQGSASLRLGVPAPRLDLRPSGYPGPFKRRFLSTGLLRCGWSAISLIKAGFSEF